MNRIIYFLLYFSEGAPIGFIWWALPALLSKQGFSVTSIATISAVATIPWTLKFIMAPFIDLMSMHWIRLKGQLMIYQLIMGISMFFVPKAIAAKDANFLILILCIHGFFAALQDICIDALAIRNIPEDETGKINGIMQAGMLVGRSLFGGAGVFIAAHFGIDILTYFLVSSIWISLIALQKTKFEKSVVAAVPVKKYLKDFGGLLTKPIFWLLIAITYFSGFSYNGVSTIASAVLSEFNASATLHGIVYSILLPASMTAGALLAGYLSDQKSAVKTLQGSLILSVISSLLIGWMFDHFPGMQVLIAAYVLFYFFIGATTASLYGFLMKNTSKEFAALEYSIFMAVVNLNDSSSSYLIGQFSEAYNYFIGTALIGAICTIGFILLFFYKRLPQRA